MATRVIGSTEVVAHGETVLLVPAEDAQTPEAALAELLEGDARRALYGGAGRRSCLRDVTLERVVARTRVVYDLARKVMPDPVRRPATG